MFQILFCFQAQLAEIAVGEISSNNFSLVKTMSRKFLYWSILINFVSLVLEKGRVKKSFRWQWQWQIQGRGPGGPGSPLFLDQSEARRAEKFFLENPHPLSQGLDTALGSKPLSIRRSVAVGFSNI